MRNEKVCVVPTPKRDATMYSNEAKAYVRKSPELIRRIVTPQANSAVESAKKRAQRHGFTEFSGQIDLWTGFRSDEVQDAVDFFKELITAGIGSGYMLSFIYVDTADEDGSEFAQSTTIRSLTFRAFKATR